MYEFLILVSVINGKNKTKIRAVKNVFVIKVFYYLQ